MIFARAGLRYHLRHPWQGALAVAGVALGVAVVVAVQLANASAERAFTRTAEALAGAATHQLTAGTAGIPEAFYSELRRAGVRPSAPVVEGFVRGPGEMPLRVLGIDPWAEAGVRDSVRNATSAVDAGVWLTGRRSFIVLEEDARRLGVAAGDQLDVEVAGRAHRLAVAAVVLPPDRLTAEGLRDTLIMDIAAAQELLGRVGRLDRIDLVLPPEGLEVALPDGVTLRPVEAGIQALDEMTAAFRLNLTAFSLLSLLVGALLIYNAVSFSVVQRRPILGRLRAVGVGRGRLFTTILAEGLLLGALGAALGLPLGIALAELLLELVTRTISDLYFVLAVRDVALVPSAVAAALALGVGAAGVAAAVPAWEAASVAPRAALQRSALEGRARRWAGAAACAGAALAITGAAALLFHAGGLVAAFFGIFLILAGSALVVPWAVARLATAAAAPAGWVAGSAGRMAARGVAAGLSRSGVAATALVVAVAAVVGVSVMIDSFRAGLSLWLDGTLAADVYISTPSVTGDAPPLLDPALAGRLRSLPEVAAVTTTRYLRVPSPAGEVRLRAHDLDTAGRAGFRFKERDDRVWGAFEAGKAALITEPFSFRHGLGIGDEIALMTPGGERRLPVAGVVYDYTTSQGAVLVGRSFYERHWREAAADGTSRPSEAVNALSVYGASGVETEALIRLLRDAAGTERMLRFRSDAEIRSISLDVFDRTFAITQVLRLLAVVVAAVGIFGALLALSLERVGEVAVLRALGLGSGQVWLLELSRTGLLGLFAGLLAVGPGLALAWALTAVINQRAFGWSLALQVDPWLVAQAVVLAAAAALLAGLYPAWRAAGQPVGAWLRAASE